LRTKNAPSNRVAARGGTVAPDFGAAAALLGSIPFIAPDTPGGAMPEIAEQLKLSADYEADVCVIGSGPAGYVAAIRAAQLGARVIVVEKNAVGGICLNIGCIPTKVLLSCVAALDECRRAAQFGVDIPSCGANIPVMMARKDKIVKQLTSGVEGLFRKNKIRLARGLGRITGIHEVTVEADGKSETITTDKILIATGSVPAVLPLPGLEIGPNVWTSTEALSFDAVPDKLLVIGAGVIGIEAGYMFARLGAKVTVVEIMSQIMPAADAEIARDLKKALELVGIKFLLNSTVVSAEDTPNGKRVTITAPDGEHRIDCDKALVAVGRRAVMDGIGLETIAIKHDSRKIQVNESMQTNIPNVYAAGDVIGEPMLAHVGWTEGIVAVEHALGLSSRMSYKACPACVYTTPECASVGLTEEQARELHKDIRVGKFGFGHNGKAMAIGETDGYVKVITEPRFGEILGLHIIGPHASDMIAEAVLAIANELTVDELMTAIHPHPTLSEVIQEAAYDARGRSIHK